MTPKDEDNIRTKVANFIEETACRKSVVPTLISTFGIKNEAFSNTFQQVLTLDSLFK